MSDDYPKLTDPAEPGRRYLRGPADGSAPWKRSPLRPIVKKSEYPPVRCAHIRRKDGTQCENFARPGGLRCVTHGGGTRQVESRILTKAVDSRALTSAQYLTDYEQEKGRHPLDVLMESLWRASALAAANGMLLSREPDLVEPTVYQAQMRAGLERRYSDSIKQSAQLAKLALEAGIDNLKLKAMGADVQRFAEIVRMTVDDDRLGLEPHQKQLFLTVVAENMRRGGV